MDSRSSKPHFKWDGQTTDHTGLAPSQGRRLAIWQLAWNSNDILLEPRPFLILANVALYTAHIQPVFAGLLIESFTHLSLCCAAAEETWLSSVRINTSMQFSDRLKEVGPWAWSPDGTMLAACDNSRLVVRETKTLTVLCVFSNSDVSNKVEWSHDSRFVLCAMYKRGIVQVNAQTSKVEMCLWYHRLC